MSYVRIKMHALGLNQVHDHVGAEAPVRRNAQHRVEGRSIRLEFIRKIRIWVEPQFCGVLLGVPPQYRTVDIVFFPGLAIRTAENKTHGLDLARFWIFDFGRHRRQRSFGGRIDPWWTRWPA